MSTLDRPASPPAVEVAPRHEPEFNIEVGLRDYYLAESERLRADFEKTPELSDKLSLGRAIESFLDRAADYDRRISGT